MSEDRSTAFCTMSRGASMASFGLKAMAVSCVVWLVGDARVGREASAGAVRGPAAGQLTDLPAVFGAQHRLPVRRLGRGSPRVVALGTDLLNSVQWVGDHPVSRLRCRELIDDEVARLGLTTGPAPEDESLV